MHRRHYLPFSRNKNFTGRQREIAQLQQLLFTDSDGQSVALVGLGGVGKTQIALQLAHLIKNNDQRGRSYSVIWMPALSMASFESACSKMISQFGVELLPGENPKDTFKRFLCSEEAGKWFLILDNADDMEALYGTAKAPEGIAQFVPDCEHGYILFTTRSREVAASVVQNNVMMLSDIDGQDAKALLQSLLSEKGEMQDTNLIDKLLRELAYLPLAITQASAYMNINEVSVKEYLSLLRNTDQDMVELLSQKLRDGTHYDPAQGAIATTWSVSFKRIHAVDKEAMELLSFMALLEPKAIPRALLLPKGSEQSMTRAIGTLCGYSLLSKREDGETFDMDNLVRLATQRWSEEEGLETGMRQLAFVHIANALESANLDNSGAWRQYMPHALRLLTNTDGVDTEAICHLGYWVGRCLQIGGQIRQAVGILESVVEIRAATLDQNNPARLTSQHELASAYLSDGQIKEAIELLEDVIAMRRALAENNPGRLASQQMLAIAYRSNGQIKEAVELLEHVVAVKTGLAENDLSRLTSQHELASTYQSDEQIEKAIELLEHVVATCLETLSERHPDRLVAQHNLGAAYRSNGQVKEAIGLLSQVVLVQANTLTEDHPGRLAAQYELAMAFQANGQIKEAIGLLEQVVAIQAGTLPEDHPDRQKSIDSLQEIYTRLED